jgi:nicotinamidase-related amidase
MTNFTHSPLLTAADSQLIVIDVQERLLPVIQHQKSIAASIRFLMDAAEICQVPVVVTEQYPKGLGLTVETLRNHSATVSKIEKLRFSAADELSNSSVTANQVVLAGIESHICVQQTALELRHRGIQVFVAADCIGSRHAEDSRQAIDRMHRAGIVISTAEAIAFEWCERAGTERFKSLSRLVRDRDAARVRAPD